VANSPVHGADRAHAPSRRSRRDLGSLASRASSAVAQPSLRLAGDGGGHTALAFSPSQRYCCVVPIPDFDEHGVLPPGVHVATWPEVRARYGYTAHRRKLLNGLEQALASLKEAGCRRAYIDGSFVTKKRRPGDFDGCWEEDEVNPDMLHPALLMFDDQRAVQKAVFGGEMFPASARADAKGSPFVRFFQLQKETGAPKGIVCIDLTGWTP
jgi:hypothetical protein